jgi:hypothetical protein
MQRFCRNGAIAMDDRQPEQEMDEQREPSTPEPKPVRENPSYYRATPFVLTDKDRRAIAGAIAEIDMEQMRILRTMTPAQRVRQAASLIEAAEQVGAYRLRQREPHLSEEEALRIVRGGLLNYYKQRNNKP